MYFDVAKHIYDMGVMLDLQSVQDMRGNTGLFLEMSGYKRLEETRRTGSDLADRKFSAFKIFCGMSDNTVLKDVYQSMQKNYVFSEKDLLPFEFVTSQWKKLQEALNDMVVLVDTNVIIDYYCEREEFYKASKAVMTWCGEDCL